ncbi:MAG: hypothetical protein ABI539_05450 [Acidobacteriota bacterium]
MTLSESLISELPDPDASRRFLTMLAEKHPVQAARLGRSPGLYSDVLTVASFSPLLASTLLQHPDHITWLGRERSAGSVRGKEDLLESLARFSLTHSLCDPHVLFSRFRRRELLRIFLSDIRRLATIAEITEGISNLADAILEDALRLARQELENRYGTPTVTDIRDRSFPAQFCAVALGKLGSKELNYASDIDLLFIYSADGMTSAAGKDDSITNREFFIKLVELVTNLVGRQVGEGAAYRVDLRLRPHGRVGPLAMSLSETIRYYRSGSQAWERQTLIRSRSCAGDNAVFKEFFKRVETTIFRSGDNVDDVLERVKRSKKQIDVSKLRSGELNVKLGRGGIREIEFIAQALQLAHGGRDRWLRAPHTLISLQRLADRGFLSETELSKLFGSYDFLRRLEHILQMEHGLQTHVLPAGGEKRDLLARRMGFVGAPEFQSSVDSYMEAVAKIFDRIFGQTARLQEAEPVSGSSTGSVSRSNEVSVEADEIAMAIRTASSRFGELLDAALNDGVPISYVRDEGLAESVMQSVRNETDLSGRLSALRKTHRRQLLAIVGSDILRKHDLNAVKRSQSLLAEACISAAVEIARVEFEVRSGQPLERLHLAVLGLGKLGGAGIDYDSDLDLVVVYDDSLPDPPTASPAEFYGKAVELIVNALSSVTRDGSVYRVDLRLRPHGKNGPGAISRTAFVEYVQSSAEIWELLAYVKLRAVGGEMGFAGSVETEVRRAIHDRAASIGRKELADETRRIRMLLESERSRPRAGEIDIKYGEGGILDIYFAIRFLQLAHNISDEPSDRSTRVMLDRLKNRSVISDENYACLSEGYSFLSLLDHQLRLFVGRTTRLAGADRAAIRQIANNLNFPTVKKLVDELKLRRIDIRAAFDDIVG